MALAPTYAGLHQLNVIVCPFPQIRIRMNVHINDALQRNFGHIFLLLRFSPSAFFIFSAKPLRCPIDFCIISIYTVFVIDETNNIDMSHRFFR